MGKNIVSINVLIPRSKNSITNKRNSKQAILIKQVSLGEKALKTYILHLQPL